MRQPSSRHAASAAAGGSKPADGVHVHSTAEVAAGATVGPRTRVWHFAQVREGAVIGADCILGKGVYIDRDVRIGASCKLQNGVSVFHGFTLEDGVFLGPGAMLLNDRHPRAITADGRLKADDDWTAGQGTVCYGASVGGGAIVLPGVRVGRMALAGAGSVITRDVPDRGIVVGNPARLRGFACDCGRMLTRRRARQFECDACGLHLEIEEPA